MAIDLLESFDRFAEHGVTEFPAGINAQQARKLRSIIEKRVNVGPHIFMDEKDYRAQGAIRGVNPGPGRQNLLEELPVEWLEQDATFEAFLSRMLGPGYDILLKKIICGIPYSWLPNWLERETNGKNINNLNKYIKEKYRTVTHFLGIDFHQDTIDFPGCLPDFLTLYVYLDEVSKQTSPLVVLLDSFRLGASVFPHDLCRTPAADGADMLRYRNGDGGELMCPQQVFTGGPGAVFSWHGHSLHGTQLNQTETPRLSLRYIIKRDQDPASKAMLDEINTGIAGPLVTATTHSGLHHGNIVQSSNV